MPKPKRVPVRLPDDFTFNGLNGPMLTAKAAVLLDFDSGSVLYSRHPYEQRPPASLTKMVSALLIVQSGRLDDKVVVSKRAAAVGESSMALKAGETLTLRDLLDAAMLKSANNAAAAAAEYVGGTMEQFVAEMNAKALELGALQSHFVNPHGLNAQDHYSCAMDLAIIARCVMQDPTLRAIAATRRKVLPWPGHKGGRVLDNRNRLLPKYPLCDGVKTGYTRQAGRCLAASATTNGLRLIAVVLDCKESWWDAKTLLEWGFGNYQPAQPIGNGEPAQPASAGANPAGTGAVGGVQKPAAEVEPTAAANLAAQSSVWTPGRIGACAGWLGVVGLLALGALRGVKAYGASAEVSRERRRRIAARLRAVDTSGPRSSEWRGGHPTRDPGGPGSGPRPPGRP